MDEIRRNNGVNSHIDNILSRETEEDSFSFQEILQLLRLNLLSIIIITLASVIVAAYIAINKPNMYRSSTVVRISEAKGSILDNTFDYSFGSMKSSSFVENEIEVMKIYSIREKVASNLIDSIEVKGIEYFDKLLSKEDPEDTSTWKAATKYSLVEILASSVSISQKKNLELVDISAESSSPYEAALICNEYAKVYRDMNQEVNRTQLTLVKRFLKNQVDEKYEELLDIENKLSAYQQERGIVSLDFQSSSLIRKLSELESRKDGILIDLSITYENLKLLTNQLSEKEPKLAGAIENFTLQAYIDELLSAIARQRVKIDMYKSTVSTSADTKVIAIEEQKLSELIKKRDDLVDEFRNSVNVASKDEVKSLTNQVLFEQMKIKTLKASIDEIDGILVEYNREFEELPMQTIGLARLERSRVTLEKLYLLVQEKYQEALVNEQSIPANVVILDQAREARDPFKPNRKSIVIVGAIMGFALSLGFVFVRNFFDNSVKTPEDIAKLSFNLLAWIPRIEIPTEENRAKYEFITRAKPNSSASEAFRALRTRLQFLRRGKDKIRTVMVTSGSPKEGKTVTSINLASSIAQSGKKTIIIDCDLRKPRMHKVFGADKKPGMTEYFVGEIPLEKAVRQSDLENLHYMTCGSIPSNPAEILGSEEMEQLLEDLKQKFDFIVLDSPPIIAVTDSEILSCLVDATILVVKSEQTEKESMKRSVSLLTHEHTYFAGIVLNDFVVKKGYYSYYKYYYYYSSTDNKLVKDSDREN